MTVSESMKTWKGASPRQVINEYGYPTRELTSPEGNLVYEYRYQGVGSNQYGAWTDVCHRSFEFKDNAVIRWQWKGNACSVRPREY